MHLKTLSLVGFKSFADRTRIECEPGVTVVVGPNGSGKSNLVDALAWVMGTQATTTLRTQRMEDVIFAGTAIRPALGRAEVSLTFDNSSGQLAVDVADVTVTRRLFRDGTSEYEVNGTPCRLLDIQELLSDSGVGRHQHVIVGQGRVDGVLNAGPEEHRAVIEEAAGVVKHRGRRDRAVRRLEATAVDLERLRDIHVEQERRLRPLKRQASAAARHDEVHAEWRALRLWLGGERLRTVRGRLDELRRNQGDLKGSLDAWSEERELISGALRELQAASGEVGVALDRDTAAAARLETAAERLHTIALVARERRTGLERSLLDVDERRGDLLRERDDLIRSLESTAAGEAIAAESAERAEIEFRSLEDEERSLADADRLPAEGQIASLRGDLAALDAAAGRDERESADLVRRRGAVATLIDEEAGEEERLRGELASVGEAVEKAAATRDKARLVAERDRSEASSADDAHRRSETSFAAAAARVEALEAARAGLGDPEARELAATIDGVVGTIAAALDVPAPLSAAVAAALGPWAEAFVARDRGGVGAAASEIKARGLGGVAFVAAVGDGTVPARVVAIAGGADALVDRLGRAADASLAAALLGDVVLVEGWAQGRSIVAGHPEVRVVTPEGDLITAVGVVAAYPEGTGQATIEAARVAAERAATETARTLSRRTTANRARDGSAARFEQADAVMTGLERRQAAIGETLGLLDRSRQEHQAELNRLDTRARALAEAAARRGERLAGLRGRLGRLEGEDAARQSAWDDLTRRREQVAARRDEARRRREQATAALAAAIERRSLLERRLVEIGGLLGGDAPRVDRAGIESLEIVEAKARRAVEVVRHHIAVLRDRQRVLRAEVGDAGVRLDEARTRRELLSSRAEEARESLSTMAVEIAELTVREEATLEGLRRDVDADEAEALAAPRPAVPDGAEPTAHLDSLTASLKRMGPVNPLAASEYADLQERVSFLEGQLNDLEESRAELRKVIKALDAEIARLFEEAFEDIAAKFAENFSVLFPGGTGRLTLTSPDDVLATGVDIHAQPMGKKVGRLAMLSGGERSLAALAFLFAVFRSRPSPFYVLDEVEAALDDANLRRFIRLVDTLRGTSQLVIVTHQQQTMEAADVLYGVTMEPGESSRVLAKRLSRV
ncbi:MAG TPA: chromosome segregation protein SMC [Acidimicrobiia bacterium]